MFGKLTYLIFSLSLSFSNEVYKLAWRDIPKGPLSTYGITSTDSTDRVEGLISHYHQLSKSALETVNDRLVTLGQIKANLLDLLGKPSDAKSTKALRALSEIASKKIWYLTEIHKLYETNLEDLAFVKAQFVDDESYTPLPLANKLIFGANISAYWGLFWLEALDPCHRMLTSYYVQWDAEKSSVPFFLWLENMDVPWYSPQMHFFSESELIESTYTVTEGLLYNHKGEKAFLQSDHAEYIYIITLDKKFLITESSPHIRHISLSHGLPVLAAGAVRVVDGKLIYADGESGHYQPTVFHIKQMIDLFRELAVTLDDTLILKYYQDGEIITTQLSEFLLNWESLDISKPPPASFMSDFHLS
jgi:hypothetical protein